MKMIIAYVFLTTAVIAMVIVEYIVTKLDEENKFKKWWRKNIIADYND